jgi:hypothetical protein
MTGTSAVTSPIVSTQSGKRRGGRGFYEDRGLPYSDNRTEQRDRRRKPEEKEATALGRSLAELASKYPRFKSSLNRVRHHVLVQVRSQQWKCREITKCLGDDPVSTEEILDETGLDEKSINETLALMLRKGLVEQCNRIGGKIVIRSDGKPSEAIYWRRVNRKC